MEEHYIKDVGKITYVYGVNLEEHKTVIEKQQKRIAELEQELAELKEKDNYHLRYELAGADETITNLKEQLAEKDKEISKLQASCQQVKTQLAIQELEKVKDDCFNQKELVDFGHVACFMVDIADILEIINNQIKELKGE